MDRSEANVQVIENAEEQPSLPFTDVAVESTGDRSFSNGPSRLRESLHLSEALSIRMVLELSSADDADARPFIGRVLRD